MHIVSGTAQISGVTITNGNITSNGGGILNSSSGGLTLTNSTVSNNTASGGSGQGGGILNSGTLTLIDTTVSGNTSGYIGGGIWNSGTQIVSNSTVSGNTAEFGGGMWNGIGGIITLTNSTISGNSADAWGGGVFNDCFTIGCGTLILSNVTVTNNTAGWDGGGIYNDCLSGCGTVEPVNAVIAGNTAASPGWDCSGPGVVTSLGHNLDSDGSCGLTATGDLSNTDPLPGPLQDNGGPAFTHALLLGSQAIDAGNPATPSSGGNACEATDQRGIARPQGTACDIGAFELDLTAPAFSNLSPAHESLIEVREVTPSADVTDALSGVTSTTIKFFLYAPTAVTDTTTCLDPGNFNDVRDSDAAADDDATTGFGFNTNLYTLTDITGGKRVTVHVELLAGDGTYGWYVSASDNAGNAGASEGDPGAPGEGAANPATFILDTAAKVTETVQLQGAPQHVGVALQLGQQDAVTAEDGIFIFRKVPAGTFTLTADALGYLMAQVTGIVVVEEAGTDTGLLVLLAGDVNDDGVVDDADFDTITAELGNSPPLDPIVDYTGDDQVDVRDLVLATRNRGKSELGGTVVDTASVGGVVVSQEDGAPLSDVGVTVHVDLNGDESFAPVGQGVFLAGFEQAFVKTYLDVTDFQGAFSFDSVPFLKDGVALGAMLELQKDGFATFTQTFTFVGNTVLTIPIAASV